MWTLYCQAFVSFSSYTMTVFTWTNVRLNHDNVFCLNWYRLHVTLERQLRSRFELLQPSTLPDVSQLSTNTDKTICFCLINLWKIQCRLYDVLYRNATLWLQLARSYFDHPSHIRPVRECCLQDRLKLIPEYYRCCEHCLWYKRIEVLVLY